jgi:hypothetical protein
VPDLQQSLTEKSLLPKTTTQYEQIPDFVFDGDGDEAVKQFFCCSSFFFFFFVKKIFL